MPDCTSLTSLGEPPDGANCNSLFTWLKDLYYAVCAALDDLTEAVAGAGIPVGITSAYAGSVAPDGWLLCTGGAVSRTTYAALFAVLGTTYGSGDGATTFNLPDLRGRVVGALDNMGGTDANRLNNSMHTFRTTLGGAGGASTHTLATTELASHTHGIPIYPNSYSGAMVTQGSGGSQVGTGTTTAGGGGQAHNNVQPIMVMNYIIKY